MLYKIVSWAIVHGHHVSGGWSTYWSARANDDSRRKRTMARGAISSIRTLRRSESICSASILTWTHVAELTGLAWHATRAEVTG
jgi:hypothetical protein